MLIKGATATSSERHGLVFRDYGGVGDDGASVAVVEVPPHGSHPYAYSERSHRLFVMTEGALRFDVDGIAYVAQAGDVVVVPRGQLFQYFDWRGQPARMVAVHAPALDEAAERVLPPVLRAHDVHLTGERVALRPMTEDDWAHVCAWNADPEVLHWSDGPGTAPREPDETRWISRTVSVFAYVFIIEFDGEPIGDCWLQKLNLPEIRALFPGEDLRRIDIVIGRKDLWGKGLGTDAIRALVCFAFEQELAEGVYTNASPENPRSRRAFEKAGFRRLESAEGLVIFPESVE